MFLYPEQLDKKTAYFLSISVITPRPIAVITTLNENHTVNAAPFSYFSGISSQPALVSFSIAEGRDGKKDTLKNLLRHPEFVIHFPLQGMEEDINICAIAFPYGESEIPHTQFSLTNCKDINGKRIEQIPVALEAHAIRFIDDLGNFTLVIAKILNYFIDDKYLLPNNTFDFKKAIPLGRMGESDYVYANNFVSKPQISYKAWMEQKKNMDNK